MINKTAFSIGNWVYVWDHENNIFNAANIETKEYFSGKPEENIHIDFNIIVEEINRAKNPEDKVKKDQEYISAKITLDEFINRSKKDIYEKVELAELGYESGENVKNKKETYKEIYSKLKEDYDKKKIAAGV